MMVLVSYDVSVKDSDGKRRLRQIAKLCVSYGQRVQNSVFEINVDYSKFMLLKHKLVELMDANLDSLRFYYLGNKWQGKVEHLGAKKTYNVEGLLLV